MSSEKTNDKNICDDDIIYIKCKEKLVLHCL